MQNSSKTFVRVISNSQLFYILVFVVTTFKTLLLFSLMQHIIPETKSTNRETDETTETKVQQKNIFFIKCGDGARVVEKEN